MLEWLPVLTSDYRLRELRDRHYAGGVGGKTVGQPGKRIAFVTFDGTAGWVSHWPKSEFVDHTFGEAFVCTLFRNEGGEEMQPHPGGCPKRFCSTVCRRYFWYHGTEHGRASLIEKRRRQRRRKGVPRRPNAERAL